jgi:hypothetical protein
MHHRNAVLILLLAGFDARVASGQTALPHLPLVPPDPPVVAPVEAPPTPEPAPPVPVPPPPAGGLAAPQETPLMATQAPDPGPPPPTPPTSRPGSAAQAGFVGASPPQDRWPARYVDRPQTLLEGMGRLSLTVRQYFGGPAGYDHRGSSAAYGYGVTDDFQLSVTLGQITCSGHGAGRCADQLDVFADVTGTAAYAARRSPGSLLVLAGSIESSNSGNRAILSARLKLVVPHWLSLEIEPELALGLSDRVTPAWWSQRGELQDGNQSRAYLTVDFNVQATSWWLLWVDAVPYLPTAQLSDPGQTAMQLLAGMSFRLTAGFEASVHCGTFNVFAARHWEYIPDARVCTAALRFLFFPTAERVEFR